MSFQALLKKQEKSQVHNIRTRKRRIKKQPKVRRRNEIIKIREVVKIENKMTIQKINKTKSWFFEKINKIHKLLARLTKEKEKTHINNIRNEREVTIDIQRIILQYYERLYVTKFNNLGEWISS